MSSELHRWCFAHGILTVLDRCFADWLQFLASTDLTQPVALYDFAVTGAVINNSVMYNSSTQPTTPTDFVQQVATWKKYFAIPGGAAIKSAEVTWKPNRALFTVWFGINDVGLETLLLEDPVAKIPRIFGACSRLPPAVLQRKLICRILT